MTLDYLSRVMHLNRRSESAFARRNFLRKLSARSGHEWANGVALTQKHSSGWFERLLAGMIPKSFCNCWPGACESTPRFPKLPRSKAAPHGTMQDLFLQEAQDVICIDFQNRYPLSRHSDPLDSASKTLQTFLWIPHRVSRYVKISNQLEMAQT